MSNIRNVPKISAGLIDLIRAQIEHRATWMALMHEQAERAGVDADTLARAAIHRCGTFHGERFKDVLPESDCAVFGQRYFDGVTVKTFEIDIADATPDALHVRFGYCPLVAAWQKLGFDDARCATLCDLAMEGDRAVAATQGINLEIGETIAQGGSCCEMRFRR
ncbi:MAG: L-2-amino-thiazoline-4-carboxylic acid hydrolase [Thiocapsa sp.]|uniref:L-2-amino-thiazoline-4-carboxylic acid hydrolase n=1 Tax=Thiocapsa sp. TaxID=2024551 RepID=UPI001BCE3364|nr:L-2-amino-thiazoline-4-carboxylic acid hydrolase [Thiocapsa sp.]QVL50120.1 MAG: L-2-amino-thiazoline-4-carboxylic acid hydrolase [Thiocapsa sp.]